MGLGEGELMGPLVPEGKKQWLRDEGKRESKQLACFEQDRPPPDFAFGGVRDEGRKRHTGKALDLAQPLLLNLQMCMGAAAEKKKERGVVRGRA